MRAPRALLFATYAAVGVYVAVLLLVPDLFEPWFRDTVLGNLAFVAAVVLLVRQAVAEPATASGPSRWQPARPVLASQGEIWPRSRMPKHGAKCWTDTCHDRTGVGCR